MAPAAVSHFETGQRVPSLESVVKLAEALEVSIDALLGRAGVGAQPQMDPVFLRAAQADTATLDIIKRVTETLLADADRRSPKR
jgi:transcriptional regulator with XRE-family HTH domain